MAKQIVQQFFERFLIMTVSFFIATTLMTVFCLLISSVQLLLGSLKKNQRLLLLYLLFMAFTTMGFVCLVVMTSICLGVLDSDENWMLAYEQRAEMSYKFEQKSKIKPFLSIILLSSMINVVINFWFFFVVWSAYRLIADAHYAMRPPKTKSTSEKRDTLLK